MKTKLYTAIAILSMAFGMTACSSSDDLENGGGNNETEGKQYLSVSITTNASAIPSFSAAKTRADTDHSNTSNYNSGNENESKLYTVRFFFYDTNGNPVNMGTTRSNYVDHTFTDDEQQVVDPANQTVERRATVLVLDPINGVIPSQVAAVANTAAFTGTDGTTGVDNIAGKSLSELSGSQLPITTTYNRTSGGVTQFAMSTTKYTSGNTVIATSSTAGKILTDRTQAENAANAVDIYVERVAAKVLAGKGGTTSKWLKVKEGTSGSWSESTDEDAKDAYVIYDPSTASTDEQTKFSITDNGTVHTDYKVIAVVNGWGLADEAAQAYDIKNIANHSSWDQTTLGFALSYSEYHRSFWETSVPFTTTAPAHTKKNHKWNEYNTTLNSGDSWTNALYTMPNTPTAVTTDARENYNASETNLTKLLVTARLMYSTDGGSTYQPAVICRYGGNSYLGEEELKKAVVAGNTNILIGDYNESENRVESWSTLDYTDINFTYPENPQVNKQYVETVSLTNRTPASGHHWVYGRGSTTDPENITSWNSESDHGYANANAALGNVEVAIYRDGNTYYYTTIRHLANNATDLGYFGVVRNHEYRLNITLLAGFGTAVYDPTKVIIPVKPSDSNTYMSANINVLQWRLVNNNVELNGDRVQ